MTDYFHHELLRMSIHECYMTMQQYDQIQLYVYSGKYNSQISPTFSSAKLTVAAVQYSTSYSTNSYKFYLNFHRQIVFTK